MKRLAISALLAGAALAACDVPPDGTKPAPTTAQRPDSSWTAPKMLSGYDSGATVYRKTDEFGNLVYWTDRGGVFVVPAVPK